MDRTLDVFREGVDDMTDLLRVSSRDEAVAMLTDLVMSVYRAGVSDGMEKVIEAHLK